MNEETQANPDWYRGSHLDRGSTYDQRLSTNAFDDYMTRAETALLDRIIPGMFDGPVGSYLDFACGTGRITQVVSHHCLRSTGVDISESMLEAARSKCPNVQFLHRDLTRDGAGMGTFDLATSFRFFGNAEDALREDAMAALGRLVRTGGFLIVNGHRNPRSVANALHVLTGGKNVLDLSWPKLRGLLLRHRFRPVRLIGIGGWIWRHGLIDRIGAPPAWAPAMDRIMTTAPLARFCPDFLVVAEKMDPV
ncbi:MAG: class I SAM-dependent methyltransferase [Hyphomicrobiales bacterium]|nr:class I SAM-dependent methyltransferase [Hyphomicrobiales bacterium]MCP5372007.1 class I SAM-dependent methyltransferase [Hyphomicrobiales bacterium]